MKKMSLSLMVKKCKSFSFQPGKSSSVVNPRSKSEMEEMAWDSRRSDMHRLQQQGLGDHPDCETVLFVGSRKKQYVVSSKYLHHPLLNALIDDNSTEDALLVRCEVVLFDHLLWMIENADPNLSSESLEELAELYVI